MTSSTDSEQNGHVGADLMESAPQAVAVPRQTFVQAIDDAPPVTATRHLSAGAYIDEEFCRTAVVDVYNQPKRLVAPSYGFDLTTVLAHCLRARRLNLSRDIAIVIAFVVAAVTIVGIPGILVVLAFLAIIEYVTAWFRLLREVWQRIRSEAPNHGSRRLAVRGLVLLLLGLIMVPLMAGLVILVGGVVALTVDSGFGGGTGQTITNGWFGRIAVAAVVAAILLLVVVFGASIGTELRRQSALTKLRPGSRLVPPSNTGRLDHIRSQETGNVSVYSGAIPFIGSGVNIFHWASAQRLIKPAGNHVRPETQREREFTEPPFTTAELSTYVASQLRELISPPEPERRIPRLTVSDHVFLAGTEASSLSPHLADEDVADVIRNPTGPARHYLTCRVVSWGGQLVTSVYTHFAVQGQTLYFDMSAWALPPCRSDFRRIDHIGGTGFRASLRAARRGVVDSPRIVARAPIQLIRRFLDGLAHGGNTGHMAITRGYDYGARISVREMGSTRLTEMSLQSSDVAKYSRIIERRIVAAIGDFLDLHGIDTTEFHNRAMTILNSGVMNTGSGNLSVAGGNAIGTNARVQAAAA